MAGFDECVREMFSYLGPLACNFSVSQAAWLYIGCSDCPDRAPSEYYLLEP
jgi:hypothetical protein